MKTQCCGGMTSGRFMAASGPNLMSVAGDDMGGTGGVDVAVAQHRDAWRMVAPWLRLCDSRLAGVPPHAGKPARQARATGGSPAPAGIGATRTTLVIVL